MIQFRWLQPHEGALLAHFLRRVPPEAGQEPIPLSWDAPISDWLIGEVDGRLHVAAHVVLSKPMAYFEGLAVSPELTGMARARAVHEGTLVASALAKKAGCSAVRYVISERHRKWMEELKRRGLKELEDHYRVLIQEL